MRQNLGAGALSIQTNVQRIVRTGLIVLFLFGLSVAAVAQTRYVIDELQVNLRSGAGNQYRILRPLYSGAKLTLLNSNEDGSWVQVRTERGEEGWVPSQYVGENPIARDLLAQAQRELAQSTNQQQALVSENEELAQQNAQLQTQVSNLQEQANQYKMELDEIKRVSSNALELNTRHQRLLQEHDSLQTELDVANAKIDRLSDDSKQTWFLYGAIAVAIGVILTLIVQAMKSRRRYSEWA